MDDPILSPTLSPTALARTWWTFVLRGVLAIAFGILAFVWPALTLLALVVAWGVFAIADGIGALFLGIRDRWWTLAAIGILGLGAGIVVLIWPSLGALVLLAVIAAWAIVRGIMEIIAAIQLRRLITHEWLLGLAGAASLLFGAALLFMPQAGALAVVWLIGAYALAAGILAIVLGVRLRHLRVPAGSNGRRRIDRAP